MARLRRLGATGLSIAPLVLGGNVFGSGAVDRARSFAVLEAFVARGAVQCGFCTPSSPAGAR